MHHACQCHLSCFPLTNQGCRQSSAYSWAGYLSPHLVDPRSCTHGGIYQLWSSMAVVQDLVINASSGNICHLCGQCLFWLQQANANAHSITKCLLQYSPETHCMCSIDVIIAHSMTWTRHHKIVAGLLMPVCSTGLWQLCSPLTRKNPMSDAAVIICLVSSAFCDLCFDRSMVATGSHCTMLICCLQSRQRPSLDTFGRDALSRQCQMQLT